MNKRGSIEISFGMIFSIIIIIAIIGVAVYAITTFMDFGNSASIGLFYNDFQETVDEIWSSATTNKIVSFSLPNSIEFVCFGSIANGINSLRYETQLKELRRSSSGFQQQTNNIFLYPSVKAKDLAFNKINRIDLTSIENGFDCFEAKSGKVIIRLSKGEFQSLVKVEHE